MNPTRFRPTLLRGRFARRLTLLSGGTLLGQAILLLSSPLLTRLYTPAEFGSLAVFTALAGMLSSIMCLRYEFAVPGCRDEEDALAVVALSGLVATLLALVLALCVLVFGEPAADLLGLADVAGLIWLLPPLLWLWGLALALASWSIRQGSFRLNAAGNLAQFATQALTQLGLGALGGGGGALVVGYGLGPVARFAFLTRALRGQDWARLRRLSPARLRALALWHWR